MDKEILAFIKKNPDLTLDRIAKAMEDMNICSRLTTIKRVKNLESRGKIRDERRYANAFHKYKIANEKSRKEVAQVGQLL